MSEDTSISPHRGRPRKLTDDQLSKIRELASQGLDYYKISKQLGLNKGSVRYWIRKSLVK